MERKGFVLKGTAQRVEMILSQSTPVSEILEQLDGVLRRRGEVMQRLPFALDPGERCLSPEELHAFEVFFQGHHIDYELPPATAPAEAGESLFPQPPQDPTIIVDHTLRSGQSVTTGGNAVIAGDVNEGAEVHAAGSIYVFGVIRGTVSAGGSVTALGFEPSRMTVSDVEYENNTGRGFHDLRRARTAFVEDGVIHMEPTGKRR